MNKLIYSVKEIFENYLPDGQQFIIPPYQRGYKWSETGITQLLDDVNAFDTHGDEELFYCLQNITLVRTDDGAGFNVVDGQQRLTTLYIILCMLDYGGKLDLSKRLVYSVRESSRKFLERLATDMYDITSQSDWDSFLADMKGRFPDEDFDYQDIYYMFTACRTVSSWINRQQQDFNKEAFLHKLLYNVKLIVNLPKIKEQEEQKLFGNLNGKRVPLDAADLIRAMIITRIAKLDTIDIEDEIKRNVMINERRVRIGLTLDSINNWWSNLEHKEYFQYFLRGIKVKAGEWIQADKDKYPINYLYYLYTLTEGKKEFSLKLFEEKSADRGLLAELTDLQRIVEHWYEAPQSYHLILYVITQCNTGFREIYNSWKACNHAEFINWLVAKIEENKSVKYIMATEEKILAIENGTPRNDDDKREAIDKALDDVVWNENWYANDSGEGDNDLFPVTLLMDIALLSSMSGEKRKLPPKAFNHNGEDKEHIFPQTPVSEKRLTSDKLKELIVNYVALVNSTIDSVNESDKIVLEDGWETRIDTEEFRSQLSEKINSKLYGIVPINSLGNLCYLDGSVNRSYGNDYFNEKRIDVMRKMYDGKYIRPHVQNAFNKVFRERKDGTISATNMMGWTVDDIKMSRRYIGQSIHEFLTGLKTESAKTGNATNETDGQQEVLTNE